MSTIKQRYGEEIEQTQADAEEGHQTEEGAPAPLAGVGRQVGDDALVLGTGSAVEELALDDIVGDAGQAGLRKDFVDDGPTGAAGDQQTL